MTLKSTFKGKLSKNERRKNSLKPLKDITGGAITALIGAALITETANIIKKI